MATFTMRNGRYRAVVRKSGHRHCETFGSKAAAKAWADKIEAQIDELRASGVMQPRGITLADLIDRYTLELYPLKPWGRSKSADLARLKKELGHLPAGALTSYHFTEHFRKRHQEGAGAVVISSQLGYLVGVLRTARTLWSLDVALSAAVDARTALQKIRLVGKSQQRERRVSDAEFRQLVAYFNNRPSAVPMPEILKFCLATGMRISEVCRLEWADLDMKAKTVLVRNRKHPQDRIGNDQTVPLLAATGHDAFKIAKRQKRKSSRIFPYSSRTVGTYFTRAVTALGLGDLHLHDLRHEAISRLFAAGYRIEQVALVSGHRDWAMLKRYTHVKAADLHQKERRRL
ncbi:MAG TPA: site-specific integrase [Steroidobacteraceae bacterium]